MIALQVSEHLSIISEGGMCRVSTTTSRIQLHTFVRNVAPMRRSAVYSARGYHSQKGYHPNPNPRSDRSQQRCRESGPVNRRFVDTLMTFRKTAQAQDLIQSCVSSGRSTSASAQRPALNEEENALYANITTMYNIVHSCTCKSRFASRMYPTMHQTQMLTHAMHTQQT